MHWRSLTTSSASTRTSTSPTRSSRRSAKTRSRILGVDPGTTGMGYAVLDGEDVERIAIAECGVIATPKGVSAAERLQAIAAALDAMLARHTPAAVAVERLFFNKNVRTAMAVSEARGVALVCAARAGVPVFEYTPHQVKLAVTGYGKADKKQVQQMLALLLRLDEPIRQDDTADAVAVALCHAQGLQVNAALARAR